MNPFSHAVTVHGAALQRLEHQHVQRALDEITGLVFVVSHKLLMGVWHSKDGKGKMRKKDRRRNNGQ
jgi:hypothetical protein